MNRNPRGFCPRCGSSNISYDFQSDMYSCLDCDTSFENPYHKGDTQKTHYNTKDSNNKKSSSQSILQTTKKDEPINSWGCISRVVSTVIALAAIGYFLTQCAPMMYTTYFNDDDDSNFPSPPPPTVTIPTPEVTDTRDITEPEQPTAEVLELIAGIDEPEESRRLINCEFNWSYESHSYEWQLNIPEKVYKYFTDLPRPLTSNYAVYITNPVDDEYIAAIIEKLKKICEIDGFNEYQSVEMVIAFVQSLPYTRDSSTAPYDEYPRYPLETLADNGGDCEDTSILLASLIQKMGYDVVLLNLPNHIAIGIAGGDNIHGTYWNYQDRKYFYVETTGEGWDIGQIPDDYKDSSAAIYTLDPVPILTHNWDIDASLFSSYLDLTVTVENLGTATANNVYIYAGFDLGDGSGWDMKESQTFTLKPGYSITATLSIIPPPAGVRTRLMVWIVIDGFKVDESYSEWIDL
ncbi:MAG: hypothetical protein JW712_13465 [Dehalococcoidales bacterium]|nr:hypothetical protein [Dehalococcoidales bacterium]